MGGIPSEEGGDRFPPLPRQIAGFGGIWAAAAAGDAPGCVLVGVEGGEWEGGGGRGPRGPWSLALSRQPAWRDKLCRANACGATRSPTSALTWRKASSAGHRGGFVAPDALVRQRLTIAPMPLARPNRLQHANKTRIGLNLKYY